MNDDIRGIHGVGEADEPALCSCGKAYKGAYGHEPASKPDIEVVEDALDYADWTESELRFADGDR